MKGTLLNREFWAGVPLIAIGALGFCFSPTSAASGDPSGNLFPRVIGIGLMATGIAITLRALFGTGKPLVGFQLRSCAAITGGVLAFAFLIERAGLALAVVAAVVLSTLGFRGSRFGAALIFAAGMVAAMYALFVGILGQPIKLLPGF